MTRILNLFGVLASLILVISISFEAFSNAAVIGDTRIQLFVCLYFMLDFMLLLLLARHKLRFFCRYFILILLSIPYAYLITRFDIHLSDEALYLIRFLPIMRGGVALAVLVTMVVNNRISGLLITYLTIFFSITYFETLIFYVFEAPVNPLVHSYADTLWWAAMTITTLGSNIIPVTTIGKVCTATLAVVGMTTFPIFTAYITAVFQHINHTQKRRDDTQMSSSAAPFGRTQDKARS